MKPNFRQIQRPQRVIAPKEFNHEDLDASIKIWMGRLGTFSMDGVQELAEERTARYVKGNFLDENGHLIKEPMVLLNAHDEPMKLNYRSIYSICLVERMQIGAPSDADVYSFEDLMNLGAFFPEVWDDIKRTATIIQYGDEKKGETGNDSGG